MLITFLKEYLFKFELIEKKLIRSYIILNLNFTKIFICSLLICQSHEKNDMHCEIKKNEKIILHFNNKEFSQKCGLSKKKCIR